MTNNDTPTDAITVTQADRAISWEFRPPAFYGNEAYIKWMKGTYDNAAPIIKAFASHRTTSLAAQDGLVEAAGRLAFAEAEYRRKHDLCGRGHIDTGRAWGRMRQAGDEVRQALSAIKGDKS